MSNLLSVIKLKSTVLDNGKKAVLLFVDNIPVNPLCAPYLVTSSDSVLWIDEPYDGDVVRAAIREATPGDVFTELLLAIVKRSEDSNWGSVLPYTEQGLELAIGYLSDYGLSNFEILVNFVGKKELNWDLNLPVRLTSWVPDDLLVVLPKDRDYVGMLGHLTRGKVVALVHNPSRGIAILKKKK